MGSAPVHHLGTIIMKFLLLIAAIASVRAEAEANPAFTYATGYLPYAYGAPLAYAHAPLVYTAAAGCQNEAGAEAEADPEADPWVFYRTYGYWPHGYGHLAYSYAPYAYAGHYGYYGLGHHYGYYGRKKREATAEADADASPEADPWLLYGGYYGHGLAYGGFFGFGFLHAPYACLGGCRNYLGGLVPCAGR